MAEVKEYVVGFVSAIIGFILSVNLLTPLNEQVNAAAAALPNYATLIGLISLMAIFGILSFALRTFIV